MNITICEGIKSIGTDVNLVTNKIVDLIEPKSLIENFNEITDATIWSLIFFIGLNSRNLWRTLI